jgi:hypothetical protein
VRTSRAPITNPAPKYGPTSVYGECEVDDCESGARVTCEKCDGHFCLGHAAHERHAGADAE